MIMQSLPRDGERCAIAELPARPPIYPRCSSSEVGISSDPRIVEEGGNVAQGPGSSTIRRRDYGAVVCCTLMYILGWVVLFVAGHYMLLGQTYRGNS